MCRKYTLPAFLESGLSLNEGRREVGLFGRMQSAALNLCPDSIASSYLGDTQLRSICSIEEACLQ